MPKNLVVTYWPLSAYHVGMLTSVGSAWNEPRGCLSSPTATPMSPMPALSALAVCWMALEAVAQALNTFMNGMPVRPSRPVSGSVCAASQLPPNANWMSRHSTPASSRAICTASAPMSKADLSPKRPNGWRPTPMMATSSIARSSALVAAGGDRRELEGHDLVTVGVDVEGHHLQLDVHAEAELVGE